ncbi:MAG: SDR family oxidoreductase [Lachnospiraceae bacterium]|nr:SDR family oxidoreductase [Lachnospiraceae bacterium]
METGLKNKVVVITGGSQGIGKAAARAFAREGSIVYICARRKERLEAAKEEFAEEGYALHTRQVDVTQYMEVERWAEEIVQESGKIDVWINNAGTNHFQMLIDYTPQDFADMVNINLNSIFFGSQIAAKQMRKQNGGVILNAASYAAVTPLAGKSPYAACKAAVVSLTKSMAGEWAPYGIRVNAYIPGLIRTEISRPNIEKMGDALLRDIPLHRVGEPEDLAESLVFLASDTAGYITGTTLEISGGKRCVQNPWYAWEQMED